MELARWRHQLDTTWCLQGSTEEGCSILNVPWHAIFWDEAHKLKNPKSQLYEAACSIQTPFRFALLLLMLLMLLMLPAHLFG